MTEWVLPFLFIFTAPKATAEVSGFYIPLNFPSKRQSEVKPPRPIQLPQSGEEKQHGPLVWRSNVRLLCICVWRTKRPSQPALLLLHLCSSSSPLHLLLLLCRRAPPPAVFLKGQSAIYPQQHNKRERERENFNLVGSPMAPIKSKKTKWKWNEIFFTHI